jgi:hypothetical protein
MVQIFMIFRIAPGIRTVKILQLSLIAPHEYYLFLEDLRIEIERISTDYS